MKLNPKYSRLPRTCRRNFYNADQQLRWKQMAAPLTKELRAEHGVRRLPVRTGDEVRVAAGKYKNLSGTVCKVCRVTRKIYVKGVGQENCRGRAVERPLDASTLRLTKLHMDPHREKTLARLQAQKSGEKMN